MYQQGYRPDPFAKKRASAGTQTGFVPPPQGAPNNGWQPSADNGQVGYRQNADYPQQSMPVTYDINGYYPNGNAPVMPQSGYSQPYYAQQPTPTKVNSPSRMAAPRSNRSHTPPTPITPMQKPKKKRSIRPWLWLTAMLVLAGGIAYGLNYLKHYQAETAVKPYDDKFCRGVFIDGIDVGGMTAEEGKIAVYNHAQGRQQSWYVNLMYGEKLVYSINSDMLGMVFQVNEALNLAWQQGHQGDVFDRKAAQEALLETPFTTYTVIPSADTSVIDKILLDIKNSIFKAPVDAQITEFAPDATNPFTYQKEETGRTLDITPLKEQIYEMVAKMEPGDLQIVPEITYPTVTVEDLMAQTTLRAEYITPIDKHSTEGRNNNIRRAFSFFNGKIMQDNEKFSFNGVVGVRNEKNGFFTATEYAYGEHVEGIGGGVCQASTTLYLAVLRAGLDIVKREPHSDPVTYTVLGQDATVSSEKGHEIDFVFRNTSGGPIYITASVQNKAGNSKALICKVRIFGQSMGNVSYQLESKTVEILRPPAEPVYKDDVNKEFVTYRDQEKLRSKAREGEIVETYLCKLVDKKEVERVKITTDKYPARAATYWRGTTKR